MRLLSRSPMPHNFGMSDYAAQGFDVDVAPDVGIAQSLVRFRVYDVIATDWETTETERLTTAARRRNAAVLR
jgi:hypothetical protein